jgi:hypothetical protein
MPQDDANFEPWMLSQRDADTLASVRDEMWEWRTLAEAPSDLIALGAATEGIDNILEREQFDCVIALSCTVRPDLMDGESAHFMIRDEGIELSIMEYVATGQGRSCDHATTFACRLGAEGSYDHQDVRIWIAKTEELRANTPTFRGDLTYMGTREG